MSTPVIIGVADFKNQSKQLRSDGSDEPASLIISAIESALADTGLTTSSTSLSTLRSAIDSLSVVRPWSWPYPDLAQELATRLSIAPSHTTVSPHGGNQPAKLLDEACRRIVHGSSSLSSSSSSSSSSARTVAVICGGEALASLNAYAQAGSVPPPGWTQIPGPEMEQFAAGAVAGLRPPSEARTIKGAHSVGAPIQVYPMYENGLRASEKRSWKSANDESARMYAEFSDVSSRHPASWNFGSKETEESIGTVSKRNRVICMPYPLLMCAFNNVNIAGAVIVTSAAFAQELGVPREKWVYVLGGAGTMESDDFYLRETYDRSPAIEQSLDAALHATGLSKDVVDLYDFYSCFPVVPKLACRHLGLPTSSPPKAITLLGGLTSFGGAGNNYSMHAITEMSRRLRGLDDSKAVKRDKKDAGKKKSTGLILANGGVLTYQHVILLSSEPGRVAYPRQPPLPEQLEGLPTSHFVDKPASNAEAVIETYTVDFGRDGKPKKGHIIGRLASNNHRFVANHGDDATLRLLCSTSEEPIGRKGKVYRSDKNEAQNLFSVAMLNKL